MVASAPDHFNPVAYIDSLLPEFPDMSSWSFPTELKAGISGVLEYLHEDDHLFPASLSSQLSPPSAQPNSIDQEKEEDLKVLTEFLPGMAYAYQYGSDYSSSSYSSPSSYSQDYPQDLPVYPDTYYQANLPVDQGFNISPPPAWVYPSTVYPSLPQDSHLAAALRSENIPHTPPYTPRNGKRTSPGEPAPHKGKITKNDEICANCQTRESPMWRWNPNGQRECNACNLYEAGKGVKRPPTLWKQKILRRRKRNPKVLADV